MLSLPLAFSSGPQTSTRGLKTRSQPSLDAKERFCKNACFPQENKRFLRVGWPSCGVFFPLRPPPRAIWTGISSRDPWETPLPHSTKNKKNVFSLFSSLFSLFSALFPLPSKPPEVPSEGGMAEKRVAPLWRPHLGTFGGLFWGLFSFLSFLFALRSSLFSLLLVVVVL